MPNGNSRVRDIDLDINGGRLLELLQDNKKPFIVFEGGTRSTKTYSFVIYLIIRCIEIPLYIVRCFRETRAVAKRNLVPDFMDLMKTDFKGIFNENSWNKTELCYTFPNGSQMFFEGCDDIHKLCGLKQNACFLNEAVPEISYDAWTEINKRTSDVRGIDFNPRATSHWVFSTVLTRPPEQFLYAHSTYLDNPWLDDIQVKEIEAYRPCPQNRAQGTEDKWQWEVYGLGHRARLPGAIFSNWALTEQWPDPMACERLGYGLDFGFANPTALVECCLFQHEIYIRELVYETELITSNLYSTKGKTIEGRFKEAEVNKNKRIWADQAHPDQIKELELAGYDIKGSPKTKGVTGDNYELSCIDRLQQYKINIFISSENLQKEFNSYTRKKHPGTGVFMNEPVDDHNHAIKAMFYWGMQELPLKGINRIKHLKPIRTSDPFSMLRKTRQVAAQAYKPHAWEIENPYV